MQNLIGRDKGKVNGVGSGSYVNAIKSGFAIDSDQAKTSKSIVLQGHTLIILFL